MNSGEIGQEKLNAKDMTAEIDRATDLAAPELSESKARALGRDAAENLGNLVLNNSEQNRGILTYNPEQAERIADDTEQVRAIAEIDNGYGEAVKSGNESLVGLATKEQMKDRIEEDRNMIRTEMGENGPYAQGIALKNSKDLVEDVAQTLKRFNSEKNPVLDELDYGMGAKRRNYLAKVSNRELGSRN